MLAGTISKISLTIGEHCTCSRHRSTAKQRSKVEDSIFNAIWHHLTTHIQMSMTSAMGDIYFVKELRIKGKFWINWSSNDILQGSKELYVCVHFR